MTSRISVKFGGESGQGINSIGAIIAKALKHSGYKLFAYREYQSLIKGGFGSYQLDISDSSINSSMKGCDVLVCIERMAAHKYIQDINPNGVFVHSLINLKLRDDEKLHIEKNNVNVIYLDIKKILEKNKWSEIVTNIIMVGVVWNLMGLDLEKVEDEIVGFFGKDNKYLELDLAAVREGYENELVNSDPSAASRHGGASSGLPNLPADLPIDSHGRHSERVDEISDDTNGTSSPNHVAIKLKNFKVDNGWKDSLIITGNDSISLGAVSAGVRAYFAYPMTPASSILTYLADIYNETGMVVKQAEDEITAMQMAVGSMFMGTRALVGTSGGGFDLMTETVSLSGMTETPMVCILAQRPGPATGLPTWTGAGDLNLAIYGGHGEFSRAVIAVSDAQSAYLRIQEAFNIAEKFQIPVIVLTEKQIAESLYNIKTMPKPVMINRYLVEDKDLASLQPKDRFEISATGVSKRWLPGQSEATYVGNSDEHLEDGTVTEDSLPSSRMIDKRVRKLSSILADFPEPELFGPQKADYTFVGWGSTKGALTDTINYLADIKSDTKVNYLHFEYLYPLRTERLFETVKNAKRLVLIEGNRTGQFGKLIRQETGMIFNDNLLKYDGRPFFVDDILDYLNVIRNT